MRECLKCKKDISGKHESAKFCSTSCRVMWNRKNKGTTKKMQITVLHNETMEALSEMKEIQKQIASDLFMFGQARSDGEPLIEGFTAETKFSIEPVRKTSWDEEPKQQSFKSFEQFKKEKLECENEDDWERLKAEIENSSLPQKEKTLLIKYN